MFSIYKFSVHNLKLITRNGKAKKIVRIPNSNFASKNSMAKLDDPITKSLEHGKFVTFQEKIQLRREQVRRSILVQVHSADSYKALLAHCSTFGAVRKMFHYTNGIEPMHFILVEYAKEDNVNAVLSSSAFIKGNSITPVTSQFLWFRASNAKTKAKAKNLDLTITNGNIPPTEEQIREKLHQCDNISHQIQTLFEMTKLTDLESRLRFLTARQVERSLLGMFPHIELSPFGSSVNGFGKMGCDLDVVVTLANKDSDENSRLVFHSKGSSGFDAALVRTLESVGDMIHVFLPGCIRVRKILQARVPIVKFYHQFTDVECDLSMQNTSGVHMSDFLYIMSSLDPRVRPLVFAIRKWAHEIGLTNTSPGRWITNFSLTLLVLAFLQKPLFSPPILPSLSTLIRSAEAKDSCTTEEGVNCTFLRNVDKLHHKINNNESLETLLIQFFEFYSQFDFTSKAISLNEALPLLKPEHHALYIVNPLERGLNVSKNVSIEELEKFRNEVRNAAWLLQSAGEEKIPNWGLLTLLEKKNKSKVPLKFFPSKNGRIMEVKKLFEEDDDDVHYKNDDVKKQVESIKKERREQLRNLENIKPR